MSGFAVGPAPDVDRSDVAQLHHGPSAASAVLDGLVTGHAAPAVFFLALALVLPPLGLLAFALAAFTALITQAGTCSSFRPTATDVDARAYTRGGIWNV